MRPRTLNSGDYSVKRLFLTMLLAFFGSDALFGAQKTIDSDHSFLTIHVGKSGLLSAAGHEHTVVGPIADGTIDDGETARISFRVKADLLMVLPEEHQNEIQHSMQEQVLESFRFPEITFTSDSVEPASKDSWIVSGNLMLHGTVKPIKAAVQRIEGKYVGTATIKQTDFGIQPISAVGGTVKVKNELKIEFAVSTK